MEGITEGDEDKILSLTVSLFLARFHWILRWGFDEQRKVPYPLIYVEWCSSGVPNTASLLGITGLCWCPALTTGQMAQGGQEIKSWCQPRYLFLVL